MTKYILVEWPDSQYFMGMPGCYFCQVDDEDEDFSLDQAMFVPEEIYNNYENSNTRTSN